eukprot:364247-Chlamydomonas_euryale.AAC.16
MSLKRCTGQRRCLNRGRVDEWGAGRMGGGRAAFCQWARTVPQRLADEQTCRYWRARPWRVSISPPYHVCTTFPSSSLARRTFAKPHLVHPQTTVNYLSRAASQALHLSLSIAYIRTCVPCVAVGWSRALRAVLHAGGPGGTRAARACAASTPVAIA